MVLLLASMMQMWQDSVAFSHFHVRFPGRYLMQSKFSVSLPCGVVLECLRIAPSLVDGRFVTPSNRQNRPFRASVGAARRNDVRMAGTTTITFHQVAHPSHKKITVVPSGGARAQRSIPTTIIHSIFIDTTLTRADCLGVLKASAYIAIHLTAHHQTIAG